jgi:hypothetical protein
MTSTDMPQVARHAPAGRHQISLVRCSPSAVGWLDWEQEPAMQLLHR